MGHVATRTFKVLLQNSGPRTTWSRTDWMIDATEEIQEGNLRPVFPEEDDEETWSVCSGSLDDLQDSCTECSDVESGDEDVPVRRRKLEPVP
jgi:hypothetical protein